MWQSGERASMGTCHRARSDPKSNQRAFGIDRARARAHETARARCVAALGHPSTARSRWTHEQYLRVRQSARIESNAFHWEAHPEHLK